MEDHAREIPRLLPPPKNLSPEEVRRIGEAVYLAPPIQPHRAVDVIFVFGTLHRDFHVIAELFNKSGAPLIIATGFKSPKVEVAHGPEAYQHLIMLGVPGERIEFENRAMHTGEDVVNGSALLRRRKVEPQQMVYVCHATHSGRCYRTLKKHFPETHLAAHIYPERKGHYPSYPLGPTEWYSHPEVSQRVWGEWERLVRYSERGDIAPL